MWMFACPWWRSYENRLPTSIASITLLVDMETPLGRYNRMANRIEYLFMVLSKVQ